MLGHGDRNRLMPPVRVNLNEWNPKAFQGQDL